MEFRDDVEAVDSLKETYESLKQEIHKKIIGQDAIIDDVLISIFSKGHCLLVGVPGLAKTLLVTSMAQILGYGKMGKSSQAMIRPSEKLLFPIGKSSKIPLRGMEYSVIALKRRSVTLTQG